MALTKKQIETRPEKPGIGLVHMHSLPNDVRSLANFIWWGYNWRADSKGVSRWTKTPKFYDPTWKQFGVANWSDSTHWLNFDAMCMEYGPRENGGYIGVGWVIADGSGIVGVDLDDAVNRDTQEIYPWAQAIVKQLNTYTEYSPSRTGLHLFVRGSKLGIDCKSKLGHHSNVEMFDWGKYFTVTGWRVPGTPAEVASNQIGLDQLYRNTFGEPTPEKKTRPVRSSSPSSLPYKRPAANAPLSFDDEAIIIRARRNARFDSLWSGDAPHDSNSDWALARHLVFWCGPDAARVERLMWVSGLRRAKWDERADYYIPHTVAGAISRQTTFYGDWSASDAAMLGIEIVYMNSMNSLAATPSSTSTVAPSPTPTPIGDDGASCTDDVSPLVPLATVFATTFAPPPVDTATAEGAAATSRHEATIARRDLERYTCTHPKHIAMVHRSTRAPWVFCVRCCKWTCTGCHEYLCERERINAAFRFQATEDDGDTLYTMTIAADAPTSVWTRTRRALRRASADYLRYHGTGFLGADADVIVICNRRLPGSVQTTAAAATSTINARLAVYDGERRPLSTSHGWRLLGEETSGAFKRVGTCAPFLSPELIAEIATVHNATAEVVIPKGDLRRRSLLRCWRFPLLSGKRWEYDDRWQFFLDLFNGEPLGNVDDVEIVYSTAVTADDAEFTNAFATTP